MKSNYTKLIKGICVILLYILMPEILAMFVPSIQESNTLDLIYRCLFMFLLLLLYIYIYKDDIIKEVKTFLSRPLKIVGSSLIYFLFLILGIGTISAVLLFLDLAPGFQYANSAILDTLLNKNFIILIIYVFFITLFTEQIVFRKVFKDIINNKYFFIIFSGIIYGILQVGYSFSSINDVLTIIPFAYAGIILNLSYEKTNTIVTPCLVYFFYDLFLLLITIS